MKTVYSPDHAGHHGQTELAAGAIVPGFESPERAERVLASVAAEYLGPVIAPAPHDLSAAKRVHSSGYIDFLPTVWTLWQAAGRSGPALPFVWPTRGLRADQRPRTVEALLGFYSFDGGSAFVAGTWEAIKSSYEAALTAADLLREGEPAAFALCRPPGHHAGRAFMGGYCYINNAAAAAQRLCDHGARRISILDIDYHHGNGTQDIFYPRADVQVLSLHGDPMTEYPFFLGHADERGVGAGEGFNHNYPLPCGTGWERWSEALEDACAQIAEFFPDAVVVSLGVDTFEKDPLCHFRLKTPDFSRIGARIARLSRPTLFVMEGGYALDEIGANVVGVLAGFQDR